MKERYLLILNLVYNTCSVPQQNSSNN